MVRAGSSSSSGEGGGAGGGGAGGVGRCGGSRQRSRRRRRLSANCSDKMSPGSKKLECFSPMLCHCKAACTGSTVSLMFGCKVGAHVCTWTGGSRCPAALGVQMLMKMSHSRLVYGVADQLLSKHQKII